MLTSRDIIFDESSFPGLSMGSPNCTVPEVLHRDLWPEEESQGPGTKTRDEHTVPMSMSDQSPSHGQNSSPDQPTTSSSQQLHEENLIHVLEPPLDHGAPTAQQQIVENSPHQSLLIPPITHHHVAPIPHSTAPLVARGDRPIRKGRILDYGELDGRTRRGTQPVARRQCQPEGENDREDERTVDDADAGGAHIQATDEDEQHALQATPIIESVNYIHGQNGKYIPLLEALDIVLEMALERACGAAVRPQDSPRGWKEAMTRSDREKWIKAVQVEIDALIENGTWELVELPAGRRAIGSRWVFLVKRHADGTIERYKARLVARGDNQRPGIDYDQVFAPTARLGAL